MMSFLLVLLLSQNPNLQSQNGAVTGVLRTAAGKPAVGVRVTALVPPASPTDIASITSMASIGETDGDGRYRLEGIPPGRYYITAGRVDFPTYYPGVTDLSGGILVLIPPGGMVPGVDFVLKELSQGRAVGGFGLSGGTPTYTIPVAIQVDGGGKVPIFQNGSYPLLRLTDISNSRTFEIGFGETKIVMPIPASQSGNEYRVAVADLQDGYTVKSIAYGSADVQKETLKVQQQSPAVLPPLQGVTAGGQSNVILQSIGNVALVSPTTVTVVLTKAPLLQTGIGRRVTGSGAGTGDEIYLSGIPGILYSDGTFEFRDVLPGLHNIVKIIGNTVTAAPVSVGDRDVDGVVLQRPQAIPFGIFSDPPKLPNGTITESKTLPMMSMLGRVLDEISQEALNEGTITIAGYGNVRRVFAITSDGRFGIPDLLPGECNLTVNISGYSNTTHAVTVGIEDLKLDLIGRREPR